MTRETAAHCDHHTVLNEPGNGGNPHLFGWLADRYARFRRAMADLWSFLNALGPPILPPIGLSMVSSRSASEAAQFGLRESERTMWTLTENDGLERHLRTFLPGKFLPWGDVAPLLPPPIIPRPRLAYNPRKGWFRVLWPGLRFGPYPSAVAASLGLHARNPKIRRAQWTIDPSSSK